MGHTEALRRLAGSYLFRFCALASCAAILASRPARAQDPDDDQWAGDDGWSMPAAEQPPPGPPASDPWSQPAQPEQPPPPAEPDYAGGYSGVDYSAPRYSDFQEGLSPYGRWIDTPEYGRVWQPVGVYEGWRPYLDGRWVFTSYGWTWVGYEPWGWATYHYGRWWYSPYGWTWVPGRVWAPAWVTWRYGGGACGWAPLGPRGVVYVEPTRWVFVSTRHFTSPIRTYAIPQHQAHTVWSRVAPLPVQRPGPRWGPPVGSISRAIGRPITAAPVRTAPTPRAAQLDSGTVHIYRPRGVPFRPQAAPPRGPRYEGGSAVPIQPSRRPQPQPTRPRSDNRLPSPGYETGPRYQPRPQADRPRPVSRPPTYFGGVPAPGIIEKNQRSSPERKPEARPPAKTEDKKKHE